MHTEGASSMAGRVVEEFVGSELLWASMEGKEDGR